MDSGHLGPGRILRQPSERRRVSAMTTLRCLTWGPTEMSGPSPVWVSAIQWLRTRKLPTGEERMREAAHFFPLLAGALAVLTAGIQPLPAHAQGGKAGPITDTHIHLWEVTREGGVPW